MKTLRRIRWRPDPAGTREDMTREPIDHREHAVELSELAFDEMP